MCNLLYGRVGGEVAGFAEAVINKCLHGGLHKHVFLGLDVLRDDKCVSNVLRHFLHMLAGPLFHYLLDDAAPRGLF